MTILFRLYRIENLFFDHTRKRFSNQPASWVCAKRIQGTPQERAMVICRPEKRNSFWNTSKVVHSCANKV